ncbi:MAG TPA: hypothetical protein V6D08_15510 [Candidatus Obscuribacterales bacterium]
MKKRTIYCLILTAVWMAVAPSAQAQAAQARSDNGLNINVGIGGSVDLRDPAPGLVVPTAPGVVTGPLPGLVESAPADMWNTAGATGAQKRQTDRTYSQAWQDFTPGNFTAAAGQTFTTGTGTINSGDFNGPTLPVTTTGEIGLQSPMYKYIPSGQYTYGFDMRYCHCHTHLPPTSTASIDFDIVDR